VCQLLEWTIIRPVYKISYRGILWNLESTEISIVFSQCSCIDVTLLNDEILYVKCVIVIRSDYLRAPFFSQNVHVLFLNNHSNMYHTSRPLTQNNMQVQQMGRLNCSFPAHNICSCYMVLVQWFIGVILQRNLLPHLTQILSVSPAWAVTCNCGRWIVAAELEIYPREHCEFYMGKRVAENLWNRGLTKAEFNLGGRGNWTMMMMVVVKACTKLLGCIKQMSEHYFHTDHVSKLLFPSFSVCHT
jgi:hypothetical protein